MSEQGKCFGFRHRCTQLFAAGMAVLVMGQAHAVLPTQVNPSTGDPKGNFLKLLTGWIKDTVSDAALWISAVAFLWVGWILISKFNEARNSREPDWGSVGLTAVVAGVLLVIVMFFLNEAIGVI